MRVMKIWEVYRVISLTLTNIYIYIYNYIYIYTCISYFFEPLLYKYRKVYTKTSTECLLLSQTTKGQSQTLKNSQFITALQNSFKVAYRVNFFDFYLICIDLGCDLSKAHLKGLLMRNSLNIFQILAPLNFQNHFFLIFFYKNEISVYLCISLGQSQNKNICDMLSLTLLTDGPRQLQLI